MAVHTPAQQGFTVEASTYARGRPEYPAELAQWLADDLGIKSGKVVIDLGAGTGKFTKLLVATGAEVIAVEPVAAMRAELQARLPQVRTDSGMAEAMQLSAATADVLVCAQSFHWFATDAAIAEIHRVLVPGGRLGLVWNVRDESVDWVAQITAIITPYEGAAPRFHKGDWRKAFSGSHFTALVRSDYRHTHVGPPELVILDRVLSVSFIAALPEQEKARVARKLGELIATHPALRGQKTIALPYRTEAYACIRLPDLR
jgi:SAM-dependent methyltransferase